MTGVIADRPKIHINIYSFSRHFNTNCNYINETNPVIQRCCLTLESCGSPGILTPKRLVSSAEDIQ